MVTFFYGLCVLTMTLATYNAFGLVAGFVALIASPVVFWVILRYLNAVPPLPKTPKQPCLVIEMKHR